MLSPPANSGLGTERETWGNLGVQSRARGSPSEVDIDVLDPALVNVLLTKAAEIFGTRPPLRRTGKAPKTLLAYRSETSIPKLQTSELFFTDGSKAKVECLGTGNQFVAFGGHPDTGKDYYWSGPSPVDIPFKHLPVLKLEQLQAFVAAADKILRAAGGATKSEHTERTYAEKVRATAQKNELKAKNTAEKGKLSAEKNELKEKRETLKAERDGRRVAALSIGEKPDRATIESALACITNDLDYADWIRVGIALHDGLGDAGRDLWESWSATYLGNDPAETAKKWPSFANGRKVTIAFLFNLAAQRGWKRPKPKRTFEKVEPRTGAVTLHTVPNIRITGGTLPEVVNAAEAALIEAALDIFQRGSLIVRPTTVQVAASGGRRTMAVRIVPVKPRHIAELMTKAANFEAWSNGDWGPVDCPLAVAETWLAREGRWKVPVLTGIINCPTLRADGSILSSPGYDEATGLLFQPLEGASFQEIPDKPTKEDARKALDILCDLIATFPFVSGEDRAVMLSGMLTSVIRRSLHTAPMHAFSAPTAGTGKSLLVDIVSMICDGRLAAVVSASSGAEELEKRLGAALLAGDAVIALDNIDDPLGGAVLCSILTQQSVKVRILGLSVQADLPTNALVLANGNNLILEGDVTRRTVLATLDAGVDQPELREFDSNPTEIVRADRGKYVVAALTVLRAYTVAGMPDQPKTLGSFEDWSNWVRGALIWLGAGDPCKVMELTRNADPKRAELAAVIAQWHECIKKVTVTTRTIIDQWACLQTAPEKDDYRNWKPRTFLHPEFREVLLGIAGSGEKVDSVKLGKWLAKNKDRLIGKQRIVQAPGKTDGLVRWQLEGERGGSGCRG